MSSLWDDVPSIVNELANEVIGVAIGVHRDLGPGLLEKVYETVLAGRLRAAGHSVHVQRHMPAVVDGIPFAKAYTADLVVDDVLIVEVKSVRRIRHEMINQTKTYLRLGGQPLGLVLNFGQRYLSGDAIKRVVP